jgi:hypothetical protein
MTDEEIRKFANEVNDDPSTVDFELSFARAARLLALEEVDEALRGVQERHKRNGRNTIASWFKECRDIVRALKDSK